MGWDVLVPGCAWGAVADHVKGGRVASLRLVFGQAIVRCVEPKRRDTDNPNAVEVDEQMP